MKVRMKVRPTGYISFDGGPLSEWPKVGSVVDLPDVIAADLISSGHAEKARLAKAEPVVETRPAATDDVETRPAPKPGRPVKRSGDGG